MSRWTIDFTVFRDLSWWHWAVTVPLLVVSLCGNFWGTMAAVSLCAIAVLYFFSRLRRLRPYPVQVRLAYLAILAAGALPWMQWLHWIQLVGTSSMVTLGYCPLNRLLSLAPLNRGEPLTRALVWRVFWQQPCAGGLVRFAASGLLAEPAAAACSLRARGT